MGVASGCGEQEAGVASGNGWSHGQQDQKESF